ncbi:AAA family ATPase [Cellulomonas gilvus]|uniref:Uncharacterized protein n=1 Tax=Cellulomonas gilvus (strain ATCC 13127 / NRRL B-14078) TaxID=593907 RepID=F8A5R6_CELGA|nr:AAA family ATPase [Cellulomonas gilvus]AEI13356.1 hypothetical protein Celgi_2863 [Cellulomonas gilvus ATCC 13127]
MTVETPPPPVALTEDQVFSGGAASGYLQIAKWKTPVTYFVGRNGSGKSRTARAVADTTGGRLLSTDRLTGLMSFNDYGWGSVPSAYKGVPLGEPQRQHIQQVSRSAGSATDDLYALREQPEVALRVAAFVRRALGRAIDLRESAGFLDPYVRVGDAEYSLLRDEGHGLRELVVLLSAAYRRDWTLLVVDEPELHLHPSMVRLWLTELNRECRDSGRRALIVTHEPSVIRPTSHEDLGSVYYFQQGRPPLAMSEAVLPVQAQRVTASLVRYPTLVSQLAFAPRPVLVEGAHDIAALTTALKRGQAPEVAAQTEIVECGGSGGVALWFEICGKLGIDVRGIVDLDALLDSEVQRVMDARPEVTARYETELAAEPARTSTVLRPLLQGADKADIPADGRSRSRWLTTAMGGSAGHSARRDKLLEIWRDAGLWAHPQGTLEDVLGIRDKGAEPARSAASSPGVIDAVSAWCAYDLDPAGDVEVLLNVAVERVAHALMEAMRTSPGQVFFAPVGQSAVGDSRLVQVRHQGGDTYRITVRAPAQFEGYWLDFSRETPSTKLVLRPPSAGPKEAVAATDEADGSGAQPQSNSPGW